MKSLPPSSALATGAPNIPKHLEIDKAPRRHVKAALGAVLAALGLGDFAHAVPVQIAWQVPLTGTERYVLEVASDPNFGTIALTTEVQGKAFSWETPGEGVFHWRLSRPGRETGTEPAEKEGSTFVSGTFVAVDSTVTRERPPKLTWEAIEGADLYKLYVLDDRGQVRTMTTTATTFTLPASDQAQMIELVPYSGSKRAFRHYHYNPTLTFDAGTPPPPPPVAPVAAAPSSPAPEGSVGDPPAEGSPTPPVAAGDDGTTPDADAPLRRRVHQVILFGTYTDEKLRLQKLALDLESREPVAGVGASVWSNPLAGLVVDARGRYHEHKGEVAQEILAPGQTAEWNEARYDLSLDVGWDLLHGFDIPNHMLVLGMHFAATQVPRLPLQVIGGPALPSPEKQALSLIGGSVGYAFHYGFGAMTLDGGLAVEAEEDGNLAFQRVAFDFYLTERLVLQLAGFHQLLDVSRCHKDAGICLSEGKSLTTLESFGATLGLGGVFR
jgi:hypothetical protein